MWRIVNCFAARARLLPLSFCFKVLYRPREHRHRGDRQKARIVLHNHHKHLCFSLVRESSHVRQIQFSPAERFVFRKVDYVLHGTFLSDDSSNSIAGSRLWLRPVGIPYINTLPSFEDRYGPIFNQRIYVIIFHFCQKSFLLSFIWGLYCCFLPSKWDQNGLILGTKKFGEHSPNSVVLLHFAAEIAYCCFHLLHRQKKPRRVHASAKRYQILASNSDGVNATTLLWAKSRTFRVII